MPAEERPELATIGDDDAYRRALADFAEALVGLHVDCGAPPLRQVEAGARAAGRVSLSVSAISEALNGKRLPSLDFTAELVRQLTSNDVNILQQWNERWRNVKRLQRKAGKMQRRGRRPVNQGAASQESDTQPTDGEPFTFQESSTRKLAETRTENEAILADAKTYAAQLIGEAEAEAARLRAEAQTVLKNTQTVAKMHQEELQILLGAGRAALRQRLRQRSSLRIAMVGPPGSGKGTQSFFLAEEFDVPRVHLGDVFRDNLRRETANGLTAKAHIESNSIVPDGIIAPMMLERLSNADASRGFLLHGFPHTLAQVDLFTQWLEERGERIDVALLVDIPEEEGLLRYEGRRACSNDPTHVFHVQFLPPRRYGICDSCGGTLILRNDDSALVVRSRYEFYQREVMKVIRQYESEKVLVTMSGLGPVAEVTQHAVNGIAMKVARIDGLC
ncbi:adenylate kinase family protein [Streptomyces sp. NEAU-174]|uniref:adenylate kinase family protein n=1 Tax=Streptomyces sp. NEAU-174 TaxID=3458254 RepID=UPI004044CD7B